MRKKRRRKTQAFLPVAGGLLFGSILLLGPECGSPSHAARDFRDVGWVESGSCVGGVYECAGNDCIPPEARNGVDVCAGEQDGHVWARNLITEPRHYGDDYGYNEAHHPDFVNTDPESESYRGIVNVPDKGFLKTYMLTVRIAGTHDKARNEFRVNGDLVGTTISQDCMCKNLANWAKNCVPMNISGKIKNGNNPVEYMPKKAPHGEVRTPLDDSEVHYLGVVGIEK